LLFVFNGMSAPVLFKVKCLFVFNGKSEQIWLFGSIQ